MGWVEDEFLDHAAYERLTPRLWDSVRDSSGQAVHEFNVRMGGVAVFQLKDCTARGPHCLRIQKTGEKPSIEVFLDTGDRSFKAAAGSGKARRICGYRLLTDRSALEFFGEEGTSTADQVCQ